MNYLGSNDVRMAPLTYEAAMFNGKIGDSLWYQAGYVDKVKDINADRFVSMSRLAGVTTKDAGMWTGGLQWQPVKDLWVQGFYYNGRGYDPDRLYRRGLGEPDLEGQLLPVRRPVYGPAFDGFQPADRQQFQDLERRRLRRVWLAMADAVRRCRNHGRRRGDPQHLQLRSVLHFTARQDLQPRRRGRADGGQHLQSGAARHDGLQF